ncbi:23S rRNA (adenine(2503)-C(2))-methyltransferase RlmN [Patescibacteria group bacterium]|nr:23S rRNA (adenine(2503)-C(2))-methyltransferase RlmN [Patescibacteria group bacterium]MBU1705210.1 23S rRNA (adenine(2503)-C(2))-methyltransferase RlmN [Patescibacteria group bacterium]
MLNRLETIKELFPKAQNFRLKQIECAVFDAAISGWEEVTTLPQADRQLLIEKVPWVSYRAAETFGDIEDDVIKALLTLSDDAKIETVLMRNRRGHWSVCVSTQVGCAMRCVFCATGKMGLKRNLTSDEIVDQLRFWQKYLLTNLGDEERITNVVYMGMGEPMNNYEAVKDSLNRILLNTEIGETRITVSTVGVLPRLDQILDDEDWPPVRLAISLHSAQNEVRKQLMPSSYDDFLPKLADWARRYNQKFGNRRHHLTFEYIMLAGVNDSSQAAEALADYVLKIDNVRVNLIPYNASGADYEGSSEETLERFMSVLEQRDVTVTVRRSQGQEIAAACGQLAGK